MHNSYSLQDIFDLLDNHENWIIAVTEDNIHKYSFVFKDYNHLKGQQSLSLISDDVTDNMPWVYFPLNDINDKFTFKVLSDSIILQKEGKTTVRAILTPFKKLNIKITKPKYYVSTD